MRPSCHSAKLLPCSAAYCSEVTARVLSLVRSCSVADFSASTGEIATLGAGVPSSDRVAVGDSASPKAASAMARLDVRIARLLCGAARMGDRAVKRRADLLGVFPQRTRAVLRLARLP